MNKKYIFISILIFLIAIFMFYKFDMSIFNLDLSKEKPVLNTSNEQVINLATEEEHCKPGDSLSVWVTLKDSKNVSLLYELMDLGFAIEHVEGEYYQSVQGRLSCEKFEEIKHHPKVSSIEEREYQSLRPWLNYETMQWLNDKSNYKNSLPIGPYVFGEELKNISENITIPVYVNFRMWEKNQTKIEDYYLELTAFKKDIIIPDNQRYFGYGHGAFRARISAKGLEILRTKSYLSEIRSLSDQEINETGI